MQILLKSLKVFGIALAVAIVFVALSVISPRHSLFFWMILSTVILSIAVLKARKFRWWAVTALFIGLVLAISPIDFVVRSRHGQSGFKVMRVAFGYASPEGTVNYGCILQRNPPKIALVLFI